MNTKTERSALTAPLPALSASAPAGMTGGVLTREGLEEAIERAKELSANPKPDPEPVGPPPGRGTCSAPARLPGNRYTKRGKAERAAALRTVRAASAGDLPAPPQEKPSPKAPRLMSPEEFGAEQADAAWADPKVPKRPLRPVDRLNLAASFRRAVASRVGKEALVQAAVSAFAARWAACLEARERLRTDPASAGAAVADARWEEEVAGRGPLTPEVRSSLETTCEATFLEAGFSEEEVGEMIPAAAEGAALRWEELARGAYPAAGTLPVDPGT